ncbi:GTPase IMAP family member 8-like [Poecilia latipinna]|nr:PREDICTED: GTPase IMAP family member 8-like [Poecilia latipinna]
MATFGPRSDQSQLVLLLLGETENGKSSAGNAILSGRAFNGKTTRSCRRNATVLGFQANNSAYSLAHFNGKLSILTSSSLHQVAVVDTPGWMPNSTTPHWVSKELGRALTLCHPGPDAILLVLSISSVFGQDEWRAMEAHLRLLETPIWSRAIILFTHGDQLGHLSIQEHIQRQGRTLQWLLERCGHRYQVMSSQSSTAQFHVGQLIWKIRKMAEVSEQIREISFRVRTQLGVLNVRVEQWWNTRQQVYDNRPGQRQESGSGGQRGTDGLRPALSLILLGRRKSGKSSAGNMILGREEFQRDKKTVQCDAGHAEISGWSVTVVDTPGWSLFGQAKPAQVKREILKSPSFCPAGSKVIFLLAVPVDSFSEKDRKAVETHVRVLGDGVWGSCVVLFTYGDALKGRTIEHHIKKKKESLQWVLDMCDQRHYVCDTNMSDFTQVKQLLEMVYKYNFKT